MLDEISPETQGAALAILLAMLRVIYDREETKPVRIMMEMAICGALSVAVSAAISALGLDSHWSIFAGGAIGYLGSTTARAISLKLINSRLSR